MKKVIEKVKDTKLIFCKNYNLLMYFKFLLIISHVKIKKITESFLFNEKTNFEDDIFEIKN